MDFNTLVEEIVARVARCVEEAEACDITAKPKLLVLTKQHGTCCHELLESAALREHYTTECALLKEYDCDIDSYEAVVIYNMDNEALFKIAGGICDSPFTTLAVEAILTGKKVFVVSNEVALFDYKHTAPQAYYAMMLQKVELLEASGVVLCCYDDLESAILGAPCAPKAVCTQAAQCEKVVDICKKVILEKDVTAAHADKATTIRIGAKSILTDLAKDYAHERNIKVIRE